MMGGDEEQDARLLRRTDRNRLANDCSGRNEIKAAWPFLGGSSERT